MINVRSPHGVTSAGDRSPARPDLGDSTFTLDGPVVQARSRSARGVKRELTPPDSPSDAPEARARPRRAPKSAAEPPSHSGCRVAGCSGEGSTAYPEFGRGGFKRDARLDAPERSTSDPRKISERTKGYDGWIAVGSDASKDELVGFWIDEPQIYGVASQGDPHGHPRGSPPCQFLELVHRRHDGRVHAHHIEVHRGESSATSAPRAPRGEA